MCIDVCLFPASLQRAEITPVHKKKDIMLKENYRPVSVLPAMSKVLEGVLVLEYFEQYLSPYVSGFRKGHDCQSVLVRFSESVKRHLDQGKVAAALLTDLSKALTASHMTCLYLRCTPMVKAKRLVNL